MVVSVLVQPPVGFPARLPELQQRVERQQRETERLKREETALRAKLHRIERELARTHGVLKDVRWQIRATERKQGQAARQLTMLGAARAVWQRRLAQGMSLYYTSRVEPGTLFRDPVQEGAVRRLLQWETSEVGRVVSQEHQVAAIQMQFMAATQGLQRLRARATHEELARRVAQREYQTLVQTAMGRRVAAEEELKRLLDSAKALRELIGRQEAARRRLATTQKEPTTMRRDLQRRRGTLPWPVEGAIVLSFGKQRHPELNTPIVSNGIKIQTAAGAPVRAIDRGKVLYAGDFRSYGRMVVLGHRGGLYTVYGLLGEVTTVEGREVANRETVGRSGGSNTEPGIVYFELRWENEPLNPVEWLEDRGRQTS